MRQRRTSFRRRDEILTLGTVDNTLNRSIQPPVGTMKAQRSSHFANRGRRLSAFRGTCFTTERVKFPDAPVIVLGSNPTELRELLSVPDYNCSSRGRRTWHVCALFASESLTIDMGDVQQQSELFNGSEESLRWKHQTRSTKTARTVKWELQRQDHYAGCWRLCGRRALSVAVTAAISHHASRGADASLSILGIFVFDV